MPTLFQKIDFSPLSPHLKKHIVLFPSPLWGKDCRARRHGAEVFLDL